MDTSILHYVLEVEKCRNITQAAKHLFISQPALTKQLNKLVHVLKVVELPADSSTRRDHILIKVKADAVVRLQIVQAVDLFRASVIDVSPESVVIEATGSQEKLNALLEVLEPFGVREIVRAGTIALTRGPRAMSERI